jgi:proline iminopeptidase
LAVLLEATLAAGLTAGAPSAPKVEEGFLPGADGVRLFYRKVGNAKGLAVFLHGGPGSNFRGSGTDMDPLGRTRTLVMYDQRGSGRSAVMTDASLLTADHHVRDLEAVRRHFGAERMSLVGLSWGAGLAALYAAKYPERVERLLLVSPMAPTRAYIEARRARLIALLGEPGAARQRQIRERMALANDAQTRELCHEFSDLTFRLYLADATREKLRHARARCDIPPAAIRNRFVVEAATTASLGEWDFGPLLARLGMPALVLEGPRGAQ